MATRLIVAGLRGPRGRQWGAEIQRDATCELAACVDVDSDALDRGAAELGVDDGRCFSSLDEALEATPAEGVVVATPPGAHFGPCDTALARGIGVIVEKPLSLRLEEAVQLVRLAERQEAPLIVAQNYRYMPANRSARRLVREGTLGSLRSVVCQYYVGSHTSSESLAAAEDSILWHVGVHHLDALRWVLGTGVAALAAQRSTSDSTPMPNGASYQVLLELEGGTHGVYTATYESSGHEFFLGGQEFYERLIGEDATLHVFQRWLFVCPRGKLPRLVRRGAAALTEEGVLLGQLKRALADGQEADASGRDNLETMAILEACIRSAGERRWISPREILNDAL